VKLSISLFASHDTATQADDHNALATNTRTNSGGE